MAEAASTGGTPARARRPRFGRAPRQLKFTREGRVFVLVTLGVGAGAVNTGNNLLYLVLGLMLSLIVLSGLLSESVLRALTVRRRLPRRAFAGAACLVELSIRNDKRVLPSYSIELEDVTPSEPTERRCYFLKVDPGEEQLAAYARTPRRRGPLAFTEVIVRTRYPFGLFEKSRRLSVQDELLVYPAIVRPDARPRLDAAVGPDLPVSRRGPGSEVEGLRAYVSGDEARAIHWRRTAALGRMVVRERRADAARRVTVLVDEARPEGADSGWDAALEETLARAAATAQQALQQGAGVSALARTGASPFVSPGQPADPLLAFLARLQPTPASGAPALPPARGEVLRYAVSAEAESPPREVQ